MPTIKDEQGNEVANVSYDNPDADKIVSDIIEKNPQYTVTNAPDTRESYQLGGKIPGQLGFGERPMVRPLGQNPIINQPSQRPVVNPLGKNPIIKSSLSPIMEEGGKIPKYKKGGKAKK